MKNKVFIIDSYLFKDKLIKDLQYKESFFNNLKTKTLTICPLSTDWNSPLEEDHYKSGSAPLDALSDAISYLNGDFERVEIVGVDYLKSQYSSAQRRSKMAIYGDDHDLVTLYTKLSSLFSAHFNMSKNDFIKIRDLLFENYLRTYKETHSSFQVEEKWKTPLTELFRGIDCANPVVDFKGKIVLVRESFLKKNKITGNFMEVVDCPVATIEDGVNHLNEISAFKHLESIFLQLERDNIFSLQEQLKAKNCLLDIYTCFPVVPMAFLLCSKLVNNFDQLKYFIENTPLTFDGGMNLSKAPWNNPCLLSIINAKDKLEFNNTDYAVIHGNGGIGYKQSIALLKKVLIT